MSTKNKGARFNYGKNRMDLLMPEITKQVSQVLTKGAVKYADRNWEKGMSWSSTAGSLLRHLNAFLDGEDYDPETGLLHMAHVACNAGFLLHFYRFYPQGDDRSHTVRENPKVGLDIDEVLCDWLGAWRKRWKIKEEPTTWYFDPLIRDRFDLMKESGELEKFYLGLPKLMEPEDIPFEPHCYITSRGVDTSVTHKWLVMNGFPDRPIYTVGNNQSKVEVAKDSGIDVFVDDKYENYKELNENGICTFLLDRPHNHRYDVGFKRIYSLNELFESRINKETSEEFDRTHAKKMEDYQRPEAIEEIAEIILNNA